VWTANILPATSSARPDTAPAPYHFWSLSLLTRALRALGLTPRLVIEELLVGQRATPLQELCGNDAQGLFAAAAIRFAFFDVVHRA
jgi:hypothetical protein